MAEKENPPEVDTVHVSSTAELVWKINILVAALIFLLATTVYILSAILLNHLKTPETAYFDHLAVSFLQGRVYLVDPPSTDDLTLFNGNWYVPFLPLPSFLLLPWVAVAGISNTNTVIFSCLVGALNSSLVFLVLQSISKHAWTKLSLIDNLGLTLLFGVGCVHWYMTIQGSIWFLSQICTVTFILLSLWVATEYGSPWLVGTLLGLALFGRPHVVLVYPLLLAIKIHSELELNLNSKWRAIRKWGLFSIVPLAISVLLILAYNYLRFQNILNFGYLGENVNPSLAHDLRAYGQFNIHYLPHNFWSMVLAGPDWDRVQRLILPNLDGMSLFLTTPAIIYIFQAYKRTWLTIGSWAALTLLLIPLLTYYNTGWWQFGYRYSLDFMPVVIILLAIAAGERLNWKLWILILIGVGVNFWGTWWFTYQTAFQ